MKDAWFKHLKRLKFQKVLLLGSAPYSPDWYEENRAAFEDFELCVINNAWACVDRCDVWFKSNDFAGLATKNNPPQYIRRVQDRGHTPTPKGVTRYYYQKPRYGGGTMLLNAIYFCLNEAVVRGAKLTLAVAGSDFDYTPAQTHFYGTGKTARRCRKQISRNAPAFTGKAADPLRFGRKWLSSKLMEARELYEELGFDIINAGGHFPSLLPFIRETPETVRKVVALDSCSA